MDFKQHFLYLTDYQHWANDILLNALDRLDDEARNSPQPLFFGNIHSSVDHLLFFYQKWLARLSGKSQAVRYSDTVYGDWRELKNQLRQEIRTMQRWLERQPQDFFDSRIFYQRTVSHQEHSVWVRDALTHIFTYAATERGHISAIAATLGAPFPDMAYNIYRLEMGSHLQNIRNTEADTAAKF